MEINEEMGDKLFSCQYSVVQYIPSLIRDERINIGVVMSCKDPNYIDGKFIQSFNKLRQLGEDIDIDHLKDFTNNILKQLKRLSEELKVENLLLELSKKYNNHIQFTEPRGTLTENLEDETIDLFNNFINKSLLTEQFIDTEQFIGNVGKEYTRRLVKYEDYSRKEVHDIFSAFSPFTQGAGTWGAKGIIKIEKNDKDYVFFVSLDNNDEQYITENGIMRWRTQKSQVLDSPVIKDLINHNSYTNNIYLFLRIGRMDGRKAKRYTYLGKLAYIEHKIFDESPIYFEWKILEWELPEVKAKEMGLKLRKDPPRNKIFNPNIYKKVAHDDNVMSAEISIYKNDIEETGRLLYWNFEKEILLNNDRLDLAERVKLLPLEISMIEGYDIISYTLSDDKKYIKVKTTSGDVNTPPIKLTSAELACSQRFKDNYYLVRIYNYDNETNKGEIHQLQGDLTLNFELEPIEFRVKSIKK